MSERKTPERQWEKEKKERGAVDDGNAEKNLIWSSSEKERGWLKEKRRPERERGS